MKPCKACDSDDRWEIWIFNAGTDLERDDRSDEIIWYGYEVY